MRRRGALRLVGGGTGSLAGCLTGLGPGGDGGPPATEVGPADTVAGDGSDQKPLESTATGTDEPVDPAPGPDEECPTRQDFDLEWPTDIDRDAAEPFVAAYEPRYHRVADFAYKPATRLDFRAGWEGPAQAKSRGNGWQVVFTGRGSVYRPELVLTATRVDPAADADIRSGQQIEAERLRALLADAAGVGEPDSQTDSPAADETRLHIEARESEVPRSLDLLRSLSDDFDTIPETRDTAPISVDVDGTSVELTAEATNFHRELSRKAWYYADDHVVRCRKDDSVTEDIDARTGALVECRYREYHRIFARSTPYSDATPSAPGMPLTADAAPTEPGHMQCTLIKYLHILTSDAQLGRKNERLRTYLCYSR